MFVSTCVAKWKTPLGCVPLNVRNARVHHFIFVVIKCQTRMHASVADVKWNAPLVNVLC